MDGTPSPEQLQLIQQATGSTDPVRAALAAAALALLKRVAYLERAVYS